MKKNNPLIHKTIRLQSTPRPIYNFIKQKYGSGIDKNQILNEAIDEIIDSYPDEMKNKFLNHDCSDLYLCDVSPEKQIKLKRIANNIGVSDSALLKINLYKKFIIQ